MSKVILVIEDQEDNRRILRDLLTSIGYEVIEAVNGVEGVSAAKSYRPDLILMDLSLPIMDGWEATRRLKANADLQLIPVIALTAHAMKGDEKKALAAGCDNYLAKPINEDELMAKIEGHLK